MRWSIEDQDYADCVWWCVEAKPDHPVRIMTTTSSAMDKELIHNITAEQVHHLCGHLTFGHMHVHVTRGIPIEEMTIDRLKRIIFLSRLGMKGGPWPPK